jgi:hypothetical protein
VTFPWPRHTFAAVAATTNPATTARTALAATHGGRLSLPGWVSQDVGYLDDEGEPLIVTFRNGPALRGPACLSVAAGPRRRIVLGGTLHTLCEPARHLTGLLADHAPCFADFQSAAPVQVVRLAVDEIRVEDGCTSSIVSCAAYAAAEPDLWAAFAATVAQHLDSDHGDVLAQLARLHLPGERVVIAAVTRLQPEILTLDAVTTGGASRIILPLYARVDDPRELCGRLLELAAPQAGHDWHCEDG